MDPFLSIFFEPRGSSASNDDLLAATQTATETRESPDQDEPIRRPGASFSAVLGTSTFTAKREDPDSDPSKDTPAIKAYEIAVGTETSTRTREDPDADPQTVIETATQTMTKSSGESADADVSGTGSWLEATLL